MAVRVRFAPSPTGALHPGGARTVLFNYLVACRHHGSFILRIEDTDRARFDPASLESILRGIRWLGLEWDEGPDIGGPHAPYIQSERLHLYRQQVDRLVAGGHAYHCFCTPERLAALRQEQQSRRQPPGYDRLCFRLDPADVRRRLEAGEPAAVRLLIPTGRTTVVDLLRGASEFDNATLDDPIILKSDGFPTYHLASTVDDHLMEITHVIRGTEWLPSYPKHKILYDALGWEPPAVFAHVPAVLGADKAKLSKRHGAVPLLEYGDRGYLPEAVINYLAFLGWSPGTGDEFFSLAQLCQVFELEKVQLSPAVFDQAKLDDLNGRHIRALAADDFARLLQPFVPDLSPELVGAAAPLVQERIEHLTDAHGLLQFLVRRPDVAPAELLPKNGDPGATLGILREARELFRGGVGAAGLEAELRALAEGHGWKAGDLFMSLRIALLGSRVTPPLPESAALLGGDECLARLDAAIEGLSRLLEQDKGEHPGDEKGAVQTD